MLLVAVLLAAARISWAVCTCEEGNPYCNLIQDCWEIISTGFFDDNIQNSYQCGLRDDFLLGTGGLVTATCHHHGHIGLFLETNSGGEWIKQPVHFMYDPENPEGYPVKGIFSADLDLDGVPEIVTASDNVLFPTPPFGVNSAGTTYIDLNEGPEPIIRILVWGEWGVEITSEGPNLRPLAIDPRFRRPSNTKPDLLVNTVARTGEGVGIGRLFVLEQPDEGFSSVDYTTGGEPPYSLEPFYVKHLYLDTGMLVEELLWKTTDYEGMVRVPIHGAPIDINGDEWLDLIIGGTYWAGDPPAPVLARLSVYLRKPAEAKETGSRSGPEPEAYLFEHDYTQTFPLCDIWGFGGLADCDGNPGNGKESAVFLFSQTADPGDPDTPSGLLTLKHGPEGNRLEFIQMPHGAIYPYESIYSYAVVHDWNGDGYDDVVQWLVRGMTLTGGSFGDVVLWLNTGDYDGASFAYDQAHARVLMDRQVIAWGLSAVQFDADPVPEVSVCTTVQNHHWCPINGGKYAYALDVEDWLAQNPVPECPDCTLTGGGLYEVGEDVCLRVPDPVAPGSMYQWTKDGASLAGRVARDDCRTLGLLDVQVSDSGAYECVYDNGAKAPAVYSVSITVGEEVPVAGLVSLALVATACGLSGVAIQRRGQALPSVISRHKSSKQSK